MSNICLNKEEIDRIIDKLFDEQIACNYCCYNDDCKGSITSDGNGNPIYPFCCENDMKDGEIDVYQYLEDMGELNES